MGELAQAVRVVDTVRGLLLGDVLELKVVVRAQYLLTISETSELPASVFEDVGEFASLVQMDELRWVLLVQTVQKDQGLGLALSADKHYLCLGPGQLIHCFLELRDNPQIHPHYPQQLYPVLLELKLVKVAYNIECPFLQMLMVLLLG